jgi:hypothetical protein
LDAKKFCCSQGGGTQGFRRRYASGYEECSSSCRLKPEALVSDTKS